jgi:isoleucyl-tRNA synthetase
MAASLVDVVLPKCGVEDYEVLGAVKGQKLVGMQYRHAFLDRESPVVPAPYVTLEEGTGCVHTAPGHGMEDYATGLEHGLNILSPVDGKGYFTSEAGPFAGQHIEEGNKSIVRHLRESGALVHDEKINHSYPHCWRCHEPVIFRATNQWFVRMDHEDFRKKVIEAVDGVNWVPEWGHQRMRQMVSERPDWCLSRQKSWGLPIPAFYCEECGEVLLTRQTVLSVAEAFREKGSDSWFEEEGVEPFIGSDVKCKKCGSSSWRKESDIFDVWFESGSSHNSVCRHRESLQFPADIYLEGTDQYRGWFQLSLLPSMAAWNVPPYRTVLTHGFVVDDLGKKMSKSAGNFIGVEEAVDEFHAEILRLWMLSVDYRDTISVSRDYIRKNMADAYRRIRNTFRFMLGNLADFNPLVDSLRYGELKDIDRWILDETARLVDRVTEAWDRYDLHRVYTLLHNFCAVQMSSVYLNALKDRLYCSGADWPERRSAQTALRHVLLVLCRLCAPVLVHSAEEVWEHIKDKDEDVESIHLAHWPDPPKEWRDDELCSRWVRFLQIRDDVDRAIESLRESESVSNSMDACVRLWTNDETLRNLLDEYYDTLLELLMVSELEVPEEEPGAMADSEVQAEGEKSGLKVFARPSTYKKCERCWNLRPSVGSNSDAPDLCERCIKAVGRQES